MATNLRVGDVVVVPGAMHGTLKYLGPVQGKKGIFAGVQLAPEFAARGKNSGDVEGKHYFRTSSPGSGIFLPAEKAEKRKSGGSVTSTSASTHSALSGFNQGGRTSSAMAGTIPKPNFSQSIGPGSLPPPGVGLRSSSPGLKHPIRRESLPRPSSPLRKPAASSVQTPVAGKLATPKTRPSLGFSRSTIGAPGTIGTGLRSPSNTTGFKSTVPSKFGQSLNQSTRGPTTTPGRARPSGIARSEASTTSTSEIPLGPESAFDEEDFNSNSPEQAADSTPTPAVGKTFKSNTIDADEARRLKEELAERDKQLQEQANSITEMEKSLAELHMMMSSGSVPLRSIDEEEEEQLPKDVQSLRAALREKNEKIKALTAEFDVNRADFRSTIDTLEMASTETERVYEKRVEDLLEELRGYQERTDDVESVARQFRQLEELVQELEEGLEDARRGEAEARGEVEFLRGEVERSRSEMRRERERNRAGDRLNGIEPDGKNIIGEDFEELQLKVEQRDNEIRGLKAIIQNLNDNAVSRTPDMNKTPRPNGYGHKHSKTKSTNTVVSVGDETAEHLQQQFRDLESLLDSGTFTEADIREEVQKLRKSVQFGAPGSKFAIPGLGINNTRKAGDPQKHMSTATSSTASTARPGSMRSNRSANSGHAYRRKDNLGQEFVDAMSSPVKEEFEPINEKDLALQAQQSAANDGASISGKTDASSNAAGWCEICEEAGHDILTCTSMGFTSSNKTVAQTQAAVTSPTSAQTPTSLRPLSAKDAIREGLRRSRDNPHPPPDTSMPPPPPPPTRSDSDKDATFRPAPLSMGPRRDSTTTPTTPSNITPDDLTRPTTNTNSRSSAPAPAPAPAQSQPQPQHTATKSKYIEGTGDQAGMLAGKESGVIDANKWCALCERDGHDSVDCPIEDVF